MSEVSEVSEVGALEAQERNPVLPRFTYGSRLDPDRYAAHRRFVPGRGRGRGVIGSVTVSGLPRADDHALVVEALGRLREAMAPTRP